MTEKPIKKWMGSWPTNCQLCGIELQTQEKFYDFKTFDGRWALGCDRCFNAFGNGLGTGLGQEYDAKTLKKIGG
jgi:hypothetical protein